MTKPIIVVWGRFAVMDTKILLAMPPTPLQNDDDVVVEHFQLSTAITKSIDKIRANVQCLPPPTGFVRGSENVLERQMVNKVCS